VKVAAKSDIWLLHKSEDFDRMLDEQLERLQIRTIDFYLLHALDRKAWEKIQNLNLIDKAEKALADGHIQNLGFSFHDSLDVFKTIVDGYDA
jgi:predicted aldo/keto reductase-like oxidoreductase